MDFILTKIKAAAGAIVAFGAVVTMVWVDESISLDEINALWLAAVPVLVALGVYASPKNKEQ